MFIVLYRWRLKTGLELQFIESWSKITEFFLENFDSKGSRLHRGNDGIWYAYAQWKSSEDRERASFGSKLLDTRKRMQKAIEESFPEIVLEIEKDLLKK